MIWRVASAIVALFPRWFLRGFGAILGVVAFDVLRIRRAHVLAAMRRANVGGVRDARRMFVSLGFGALETLWLAGRKKTKLASIARIDGLEHFERAHAMGRGVVVVTAHTGHWDIAACACAEKTAISVVTKRLHARGLDAFWQSTRAERGLGLIAADADVIAKLRAELAANRTIALLIDQHPERRTSVMQADFLGAPALHDLLPATIAARAGAPIVVAFARREGMQHVVDILEHIDPPARPSAKWIEVTTGHIAARLDAFVRREPSCWLWLHRRWKPAPERRPRTPRHTAAQTATT